MSTALLEPPVTASRPDEYLYLEKVTWEFYEMMMEAAGERHLQITFDQGRIEVMSPLPKHERIKYLIGMMVDCVALERDIPTLGLGSATFRRKLLSKGLEPDQCYYIQNEEKVRFKDELDLDVDPPPDLVVEVDITSRSIKRMPIYAALGVPEIWRHDGFRLQLLQLAGGEYQPISTSVSFPFLHTGDINRFLDRRHSTPSTSLMREFRDWVRQGL